jgi:FMN reductase
MTDRTHSRFSGFLRLRRVFLRDSGGGTDTSPKTENAMVAFSTRKPFIVGIGGAHNAGSSTEQALVVALRSAENAGARTQLFDGALLQRLPHYLSPGTAGSKDGQALVEAIRAADGVIIASPGYHGSISGLVKNAIDYLEETSKDKRVYLDGVPVGLIATAYGWQATGTTLATLRSIVHALRGWPTPLGAAINSSGGIFKDGVCTDEGVCRQLELVGRQVVDFARLRLTDPAVMDTGEVAT